MTLTQLLSESTKKNSSKVAFVFNDKRWTYSELLDQSQKVASGFQAAGIKPGDKVILYLKNSPEFILSVFALSHLGATAVPVNFLLNEKEILFICKDVGAVAAITQKAFLPVLEAVKKQISSFKTIWVGDLDQPDGKNLPFKILLQAYPLTNIGHAKEEGEILILYTSGTTGVPKGAVLTHANITSNVFSSIDALSLNGKDRFMCILPMFHVFAWTANICVPIHLGCPIVIVESIRPPKPWLQLMAKHKITIFAAVPQIYSVLAEQAKGLKKWVLRLVFFRTVRMCISGAAPLLADTFDNFQKHFNRPLLEGYGLTETSPVCTVNTVEERKRSSVGKPIPGVKIKIVDEEERELAIGQEGEICIQGPNVMKGYYKLEQATKESFTKDGWFKTGDIGVLDSERFLFIRDRVKDMIIVKGLKVFSAQVEEVLITHPAIQEAAVIGIPNPTGDETVRAVIVLKEGKSADKNELLKFCKDKLPSYKRPRDIDFKKELPKNALQKVLKRELRKEIIANEKA